MLFAIVQITEIMDKNEFYENKNETEQNEISESESN